MDVQVWLDALPAELEAQRTLLRRLLAAIERDQQWRWLEIGCSVAEGRGDEWSDLDLGLGVADDAWPHALDDLPALLGGLDSVVDALYHRIPTWGTEPHQRAFVQYRSGAQIDLVAVPARLPKGVPPGNVVLYDPDGLRVEPWAPSVLQADAAVVREWALLGWAALADLTKYLRRGSLWEALERLHDARTQVWRLWAAAKGAAYPVFGMTGVLDRPEAGVPEGIESTVASLDRTDLRRAGLACATLLDQTGRSAASRVGATVPDNLARFIRQRLEELSVE